jgi:DNA-binding CsgD family transcriptional regulator
VTARLRWVQEHPAIAPGGEPPAAPTAISDVTSREDFQATGLYREVHREAGVEDELIVGFAGASGPSMLTLARDTWGFTACEHALAAELQRILLVMAGVRRDREAVHVGVHVARGLSDDLGRLVLVADSSGALRGIDGGAADLGEPLTGAVTSAVAVAAATPRGDDPDVPLIEMTVPSARGRQLTVRVLPPPDGSQLFPVVIERPPAGVRHEDLRGHGLTARQAEVMGLILNGSTNGGVAHTLGISERTVEKHVLGAYAKLGARTRTEALLKVLR